MGSGRKAVVKNVMVLLLSLSMASVAMAGSKDAGLTMSVSKLLKGSTFLQKIGVLGLAAAVVCTSSGCDSTDTLLADETAAAHYRHLQPAVGDNDRIIVHGLGDAPPYWEALPSNAAVAAAIQPHGIEGFAPQLENTPAYKLTYRTDSVISGESTNASHGRRGGTGGVLSQQNFTTYVHVDGGYRSTKQRIVYPGDEVYVVENYGSVYMGTVEHVIPPNRLLLTNMCGTGIYFDAGRRKKIVNRDDIRGVALRYHHDMGTTIPLENDHRIFRRDNDDYMEIFYGTVADVYDDGYYRLDVTYGTAAGGIQVNLRDPYVIFMHKNIWPFEGIPLVDHPDIGASVFILGEEGSRIEFLLGEVLSVFHDGFYEIEIDTEIDVDDNYIDLAQPYLIFVHEDTPTRQGGIIFQNRRD